MPHPTHIRKSQPVVAWQWIKKNEKTCPWQWKYGRFHNLIVEGLYAGHRYWIVKEGNKFSSFNEYDFRNLFTPITPEPTEPMTMAEVRELANSYFEEYPIGIVPFNTDLYVDGRVHHFHLFDLDTKVATFRNGPNGWCYRTWIQWVDADTSKMLTKVIKALNARGFAGE